MSIKDRVYLDREIIKLNNIKRGSLLLNKNSDELYRVSKITRKVIQVFSDEDILIGDDRFMELDILIIYPIPSDEDRNLLNKKITVSEAHELYAPVTFHYLQHKIDMQESEIEILEKLKREL